MDNIQQNNTVQIKVGINKLLFEKRMELGLSRKDASKKLGMSKLKLTLIERGYIKVSVASHFAFKDVYSLEEEFFFDHYSYPITINEKLYEPIKINEKIEHWAKKKWIKIVGIVLTLLSLATLITGLCNMPMINGSTASNYSQQVLDVKASLIENGKKGKLIDSSEVRIVPLADDYYFENIKDAYDGKYENLVINTYVRDHNIPMFFYQAKTYQTIDEVNYKFQIESRYMGDNYKRVHIIISDPAIIGHIPSANLTANILNVPGTNNYTFTYSSVVKLGNGSGNIDLKPDDELYIKYTHVFETIYPDYDKDLSILVDETPYLASITNYNELNKMMAEGTTKYYAVANASKITTSVGLILTIVFGAILFFSYFLAGSRKRKEKKLLLDIDEDKTKPYVSISREEGKKELPKNTWFNLYVPEFFVRIMSLVLLFSASMAIFFLFMSILSIDASSIIYTFKNYAQTSSLSVIAVILLYFVKLDIYQNKKSAVGYSIFLFVLGLLYYFGLLIIYYGLCQYNLKTELMTLILFDLLPGNIVWSVLVFNLIILFMFIPVEKKYNSKVKIVLFRLCALIPFSYLVASTIIFFGIKAANWDLPYAFTSLFFYKAPMITVFALLYCVAVFIYRKHTIKKYGETNGLIYQSGNKYNFIRNIIAASIVLAMGIFDLICLFCWPDNAFGFGSNVCMLAAVPFILFYHPHIGKRNSSWDLVFNTLYGIVYIIGYVLIAFALIKIFIGM